MWASSSKACSIEFLIEIHKDSNGIGASSYKACSVEFLIQTGKDSNGMWASSSKSCSLEFLIEINYTGVDPKQMFAVVRIVNLWYKGIRVQRARVS
jgi:hypothetical protein